MALFKANTAEELKELNALEALELSEAISAYYNVTASSEFREIERLRAKAQHDEAQALRNAMREESMRLPEICLRMVNLLKKTLSIPGKPVS